MKHHALSARLKAAKVTPAALARRTGITLAVSMALSVQSAHAATTAWTGGTSSLWSTAGNWSGGVPTASDQAVFNTSFINQPSVGAVSVEGIWLATGVDQDVAIVGGSAITLTGTGTINGNANTAILLDDTANHSLSIASTNPVITLANDTQFLVNNSGTLTIFKTNLNGKTLTLGGTNAAGNINFTSVIGTTSQAGAIIVNTAGTVTFSSVGADNSFTGGVTLNAGTLRVANRGNNLGTGALTLAGGELQLATDAGSSFSRPTTVSGNTKVTSDRLTAGAGVTHSLGTLSIGAHTLSIAKGANVTSGTAGMTFGATTLTGNATFDTAADTNLKLGALSETGGARSMTKTGAGILTFNHATNTTTGGLIIKQGTVDASIGSTSAGGATNTVTLGDSAGGSNNAAFVSSASQTYANPFVVAANTTGTLSIGTVGTGAVGITYSGGITGSNNVTLANTGSGNMTFSTVAINNAGTVTNSGSGTGTTIISGGIGSNVTGVTQNSTTSALTISGAVAVNGSGLTLTNNSNSKLFLVSGVVSGSGGITKTGSGALTLSAANAAYTGETKVLAGTLALNAANSGGTGRIYVGDTTGSANSTLYIGGSGINIANNITVQTANTGITTLGSNNANAGTFSGNITLTGDGTVTLNPFNSTLTFTPASGVSITGDGGLVITSSGMATSTTGQTYGISGATVTLSGANTFTGTTKILSGLLQISTAAAGNVNNRLGTSNSAVVIGDTSGVQSARFVINTSAAGAIFSRDIFIQGGNGGISGVGVTQNSGGTFSGNLSLEKTVHLLGPNNGTTSTTFSGVISKAPAAIGAVSVNVSGDRLSNVALTNANTYDGGTIVGGGILIGSVAGSLGSGNAVVDAGSLRLNSDTALAANKTVLVGPRGQLSITAASGIDQADLIALLAPGSTGSIGISGTYSTALDLAALGDGNMYLGNDGSSGTYSASSLGASGGLYRVGWSTGGAGTLTLSTGVLVGANQLIVGGTQGYTHPTGSNGQGHHTEGNVILSVANTYTGGTVVNSGSTLQGQALTSGTVFGSTTSAMTLHNSTLRILNSGTTTTNTVIGDVAFDGNSMFMMNGSATSNNTLTVASLDRIDRGTLTLTPSGTGAALASTVFVKAGGTLATAGTVKNSASTSVTMLAPYYVDSLGNYLSYDSSTGFTPITTTLTTLALGRTNGVTSYVKMTANESIASDLEIAALSIAQTTGNVSITNSTGTAVTLKIGTGGITTLGSGLNASIIGSSGNTVILDFNAKEAVFNLGGGTQNGGLTIHNAITNTGGNGLTKSGNGRLFLNSSLSTFTGLITVNQSAIYINNDLALGSGAGLENDIFLNGGGITSGNSVTLNATRTITLGTAGGSLTSGHNNPFVVAGQITGTGGVLTLGSNNAATSTARSTIYLSNVTNDFIAPIYVGTAGNNHHDLLFDDDRQLGNAANVVILVGGNAGLQYTGVASGSTAREINFQNQGGAIDVLTDGVTLTASGPITGSGMFNKNGLGTLALTGSAASYSGTINVNGGVLNVSHANALGATTAAITGNSGVSGGAAYVQSGAALEVQGNIALGNAGGKTLYLNGSGIGNTGALRNLSGANSNAGAVIFQSNTTIAVDSGSLALSGIVSGSGALTKIGSGTFTLSGANTYSGGTTVSAGTLIVNNSTGSGTGSGSVFIDSGATLAGSGTLAGAATVNGSLNPGNSPGVMTFNSGLTLGSSATTNIEIAGLTRGSQYDGIDVTGGSLTYGGTLTITFSSSSVSGTTYDLFNLSSGSPSGSFSSVSVAGSYVASLTNNAGTWTGSANGYDFTFTQSTGDLFVFAAIPEPASAAAIAALAAGLTAVTVRRRNHRRG